MKKVSGYFVPENMTSPHAHLRRTESLVIAMNYVPEDRRAYAIQAGGHIGIWPRMLAHYFKAVETYEPIQENYECLKLNISDLPNVTAIFGSVGHQAVGAVDFSFSTKNTGKHCVATRKGKTGNRSAPMFKIDKLNLHALDALFLDIEGYELYALQGAENMIKKYRPAVILTEENGLSSRYGLKDSEIEDYLGTLGYKEVNRWGEDRIYARA